MGAILLAHVQESFQIIDGLIRRLEIEERFYQLFTLRDGKVFRFQEYSEEADALNALEG